MKIILIAGLLLHALPATAQEAKVISDQVQLKPESALRLVIDKGQVSVLPSSASVMTYQVEFVPSQSGLFGPKKPTSDSYANSGASYDKETLTVRTGEHLTAQVKIYLPAAQTLDMTVHDGVVDLGPLTGRLKVLVKNGTLRFDASSLPKDACVLAFAKHGTSSNARESDCMTPDVVLRVTNGYVSVR